MLLNAPVKLYWFGIAKNRFLWFQNRRRLRDVSSIFKVIRDQHNKEEECLIESICKMTSPQQVG